jgi:hypothetical protein
MHYQQHGGVQCTQRVFSYMNVFSLKSQCCLMDGVQCAQRMFSLHRMCSLYIKCVPFMGCVQ